jgi:NAD(P)H-dependent FMN reductase
MITIISGTDRIGSNTKKIAIEYLNMLKEKSQEVQLLSIDEHEVFKKGDSFDLIENTFLIPASKFIIILPEYNGSYPGILKLLIDNSRVAQCWHNKKVLLVGISTGRAGNLRGLEHFTGSLMHMKMHVHPNRLPISLVNQLLDENGALIDQGTIKVINDQIDEFLVDKF